MDKLSPAHVAFGQAVRQRREERGISQEDLADLTGMHRTYVGSVERGERNLGLANLLRLAACLELRGSELLARMEALQR